MASGCWSPSISYVTITRMREDILREVALSFNPDLYDQLGEGILFHDLSEFYFDASIVPPGWYGAGTVMERLQKKQRREGGGILAELAGVLKVLPEDGLIVLDSLTDITPPLAEGEIGTPLSLSCADCSVRRKTGTAPSSFCSRLGILDRSRELEIADCVDATFIFSGESGARRRQRVILWKFGAMTRLEDKNLVKFAVTISAKGGFEVRNIRMVVV